MAKSMHTIVLQLYKPSTRKKSIIDEAMLNYSRAFQYLLDKAYEDLKLITENYRDYNGGYSAKGLAKWISGSLNKELNRFCIEPLKDSIKIDFASVLAGYLNLKSRDANTKYPYTYVCDEKVQEEYEKLIDMCTEDNEFYEELEHNINKLLNKSNNLRAIYFCRYSKNRNYSLLYNPDSNRYYVKLYLMNSKNENRKPLNPSDKTLIYVDKDREVFKERESKKSFLLLPLSFGRWQEAYLKKALETPEVLKTARLVKRNEKYYISINILCDIEAMVETNNYMGVGRGIDNVLNYSVVDKDGDVLNELHPSIDDNVIRNDTLHRLADDIVSTAKVMSCKIIMEKFLSGGDGITASREKSLKPLMSLGEYSSLYKIVKYKALKQGLPPPVKVSSFGLFNTCPRCSTNSKANRFSNKLMICTNCGMTMEVERLGSLNLAKKLIRYKSDIIKIKALDTKEGVRFINKDLELEFFPKDPFDCADEFAEKINEIIRDFYRNRVLETRKPNFKRKFSLIKKLEQQEDIFKVIKIE